MSKIYTKGPVKVLASVITTGLLVIGVQAVSADHYEFPSTNEENQVNNWAHVNEISSDVGEVTLEFVAPREFTSCFEYRVDGDESEAIGDTNFNPNAHDLYPYVCLNNNSSELTLEADEYVEVRMVFGAEADERFDWTRFEVEQAPGQITSPDAGEDVELDDELVLTAFDHAASEGNVNWAVREGTCASGTSTVAGNVDGYSDAYSWQDGNFSATVDDISNWNIGEYCFIFNPTDGDRLTQQFDVVEGEIVEEPEAENPMTKDECMNGGWQDFGFSNQGQCIKYVNTGKDSR
jgi:hypothetical protein